MRKVVGFCGVSRTLFKNTRNRGEVLQKSSPCNFYRVLYCFSARQNVLISLGGAHFFDRPRAISTRCSNENRFFYSVCCKKALSSEGCFKNRTLRISIEFFPIFCTAKMCLFLSVALIFSYFWYKSRTRVRIPWILGSGGPQLHFFRISMDFELWKPKGAVFCRIS